MKLKKQKFINFLLVTLLLVISGNPAFYKQSWYTTGIVIVAFLVATLLWKFIDFEFVRKYLKYFVIFFIIFLIQYFNLGYLSAKTVFGFAFRIFIGGIIFYTLKEQFAEVYFKVIFWLCLTCIPFYILHLYYGEFAIPFTFVNQPRSVFFYTFRPQVYEPILRNSGMFWEPGAFQGYINLCLFLNLRRISTIIKNDKIKLFVIGLTLVSTQSTTGYLTFALLFIIYFLFYANVKKLHLVLIIILASSLFIYAFTTINFLGEKITSQYSEAIQGKGEFDPRRFGALLFDWHYIKKNPFTGNGFHEKTRFSDHVHLILETQAGENLGLGNGFSSFVASAGILGMLWYLFLIIKNQDKEVKKDGIILCALLIFLLQGEPFLNFSFFLSMPFIHLYHRKYKSQRNPVTVKKFSGSTQQSIL